MEHAILVYVDLVGIPMKVGQLWGRFRNGRESMSFEYDRDWLNHPKRFSLDPALKLVAGSFHAASDKPLFGAIEILPLIVGVACLCVALKEKMLNMKSGLHVH
jgi:hypothetical protein